MPDVFGPFDTVTWMQAQWFRDAWARSPLSGVFGPVFTDPAAGDLSLTVSGLTVTMGLGRAHVRGAAYERTGTAWTYAVPANTSAQARLDRLVLRRDLAGKTVTPIVLQGVPAAAPALPALQQNEDGTWDLPLFHWTTPANSGAPLTAVVDDRAPIRGGRFWGSSGMPLPTADQGAQVTDLVWATAYSCLMMRDATGNWRQITDAYTNAGSGGIRGYDTTARAAGVTVFHGGFRVVDLTTGRLYVSDGSAWQLIGGATATVTTGFTSGTGWSVTLMRLTSLGNGMASVYVEATKTGTALTVPVTGDVSNGPVCQLPAGWESAGPATLVSGSVGRMTNGYMPSGSGTVAISGTAPGANIAVGDAISLGAVYQLADPLDV